MPEFVLDTSGKAYMAISETSMERVYWEGLDPFTQGYIEALFFTESDCGGFSREEWNPATDSGLPGDVGFADFDPETLAAIVEKCRTFQQSPAWIAFEAWRDEDDSPDTTPADDEQAGRDFWFTRCGHGVGFWDRPAHFYGPHRDALDALAEAAGNTDAYLGDDGKVHLS